MLTFTTFLGYLLNISNHSSGLIKVLTQEIDSSETSGTIMTEQELVSILFLHIQKATKALNDLKYSRLITSEEVTNISNIIVTLGPGSNNKITLENKEDNEVCKRILDHMKKVWTIDFGNGGNILVDGIIELPDRFIPITPISNIEDHIGRFNTPLSMNLPPVMPVFRMPWISFDSMGITDEPDNQNT